MQAAISERSRNVFLSQWQELLRLRREVLKSPDLDAIHDLRVASRRLRAVVALFAPWIAPKRAELLKKNMRKLTRLLGGLRNIDEAQLFFRQRTPAKTGGAYQISRLLSELRPAELARIKKALASLDHRRLDRVVRKAAAGLNEERMMGNGGTLPEYFAETGIRLYQPILALLPTATASDQRTSRHALRIAIKKWRYFLEITAPVLERDYKPLLGQLKEYQTILGSMNDVAEFEALCAPLALSRHERVFIETSLQAEDKILLQKLTELMEEKPLVY